MKATTIIFDLDGTLTNTLDDLWISTNYALNQMGWKERTIEEVKHFVGNGIHKLIERSVPVGVASCEVEKCFEIFQEHYITHCQDHTGLYPGVKEMLHEVKQKGFRTAIVSNKVQAGVNELYNTYFRGLIDIAVGQNGKCNLKPSPEMVEMALTRLHAQKEETLYVGDSEVDVMTARNSGLTCISVLWGFRGEKELQEAGADTFISHPSQLVPLIEHSFNS